MAVNAAYVQNGGYAASLMRQAQVATLVSGSSAAQARAGILPYNGSELLPTVPATPNMTTVTPPGQAVIPDASGGAYVFTNTAAVTLTHAASDSTNPRIDLVIARIYDNEAGDAAATTALVLPGSAGSVQVQSITGAVEIVKGVAAANPQPPAVPNARCLVLRQVQVRAGASSIVAGDLSNGSRAGFTVAAGAIQPVATQAAAAALPGSQQYEGQYFDALDTNLLLRSNGASVDVIGDPVIFQPWTAYTPSWTGETSGAGSVGTGGQQVGWFKKVGATVLWRMRMLIGSGATGPSGIYRWALPTPYPAVMRFNADEGIGSAMFFGGALVVGAAFARNTANGAAIVLRFHGQTAEAQSGNPGTWAQGASVEAWGAYETAP